MMTELPEGSRTMDAPRRGEGRVAGFTCDQVLVERLYSQVSPSESALSVQLRPPKRTATPPAAAMAASKRGDGEVVSPPGTRVVKLRCAPLITSTVSFRHEP